MASSERTASEVAAMGGLARAAKLTPEQQSEIARRAANARWAKRREPMPDATDDPDRQHARALVAGVLKTCKPDDWLVIMRYFAPWLAANDPAFLFDLLAERCMTVDAVAGYLGRLGLKVVPA